MHISIYCFYFLVFLVSCIDHIFKNDIMRSNLIKEDVTGNLNSVTALYRSVKNLKFSRLFSKNNIKNYTFLCGFCVCVKLSLCQ
jgi:hypothetical protein